MIVVKKVSDLRALIKRAKSSPKNIGFVPTMGALHQGHLSLITASTQVNPITVCSIFVNPTQFNDPKDFEKYPVTIENDIRLLHEYQCNVLFLPSVDEIYPAGLHQPVHYDLGYLETILEGKYRPGHFQGVCQVMNRLLDIVEPDNLYMGQKDYQQCMVVKKLIELIGSHVILHPCPTLREDNGLAMSSRNLRLNEEERERAGIIFSALQYLKTSLVPGPLSPLLNEAIIKLDAGQFQTDYFVAAHAETLQPADSWDGQEKLVALVAAFINDVRLIDNMLITG
jgi:pantoate--beta-alanine ligase